MSIPEEKVRVYKEYRNSIYKGVIRVPTSCQHCGAVGKINGHHEDYDYPMDVMWLCTRCHGVRHRIINFIKKYDVKSTSVFEDGCVTLDDFSESWNYSSKTMLKILECGRIVPKTDGWVIFLTENQTFLFEKNCITYSWEKHK